MKRDKLEVVVFSLISLMVFAGCHTSVGSSGSLKEKEPKVTQTGTKEKEITSKQIKNFIKNHEDEYGELFQEVKESELHIETKTMQEKSLHFLLYSPEDYWGAKLYQIQSEGGEIISLDYIAEGAATYFKFDIITMSEGDFVTVYSASHMGNGYLEFINMKDIPDRKTCDEPDFKFYAIDDHYEDIMEQGGSVNSQVFEGAFLVPEYKDINQDGHTDIILNGTVLKYTKNNETGEEEQAGTSNAHVVYLYDPAGKVFNLHQGEDLRERKPLSISDTVINNHELLNDSPCTEYTVKDIYQYYGKPEKIITQKDEKEAYRHYLVYDGIMYVVVNDKKDFKYIDTDQAEYIDYVILTSRLYSMSVGIQAGMEEAELLETGIDFEMIKNGDDLDSELLSGKTGYLRKMRIPYDTIYYAESSYDENIALAVMVKGGKVSQIATDKLY